MALLSLQQIHKTFEKGTVNENHVLRGLDLDIEQGDFISVIGGNGAGKSTLMNSIAGVLSIDEGDILLDGQSIKKASVDERSKDISRVFQDPRMGTATNLSIEENMAIAYRRGKKRSFFKKSITESERQIFKEALVDLGLGLENRMKTDANFLTHRSTGLLRNIRHTVDYVLPNPFYIKIECTHYILHLPHVQQVFRDVFLAFLRSDQHDL